MRAAHERHLGGGDACCGAAQEKSARVVDDF
jgi:hypothetical protein